MNALFWDRDSHGLFDYESKTLKANQMLATGCFLIARDEATLKQVIPKLGHPESYQLLLSVVYKSGAYWLYHNKTLYKKNGEVDEDYNHFEQAWQIVRMSNMKGKRMVTAEDM